MVTMKVLSAQSGGVILFYGCYIITIGFIAAVLCLIPKSWIYLFLILGGLVSVIGLSILYSALKKDRDTTLIGSNLPPNNCKPEERHCVSLIQNFNCSSEKK